MNEQFLDQWEANAQAYAALIAGSGTPHHQEILNPFLEQIIGDVEDQRLLDAGCGEGYLSREYALRGAKVVGVDFSPTLIQLAQQQSKGLGIDFRIGDICRLDFLSEATFDLILCNLVLLNLSDYKSALMEFFRVLKPRGTLIFSIVHPAFNIYGPGRWKLGDKDPVSGRRQGRYFIMDHYFDEKEYLVRWKERTGKKFPEDFSFFHRPISTYINTLIETGFIIVTLGEPLPTTDDPFFEREKRIPFFLVFKAMKPKTRLG